MYIDIKQLVYESTGLDMKISGGLGLTPKDTIYIFDKDPITAVNQQDLIVHLLARLLKLTEPSFSKTNSVDSNDSVLDKVDIKHIFETKDGQDAIKITPIYFDLTFSRNNTILSSDVSEARNDLGVANSIRGKSERDAFVEAASLAILYGSSDLSSNDFVHVFDIKDELAEEIFIKLGDIGLLDSGVHAYYQEHFGDIYPEGHWEFEWIY